MSEFFRKNLAINTIQCISLTPEFLEPLACLAGEHSLWEYHAEALHDPAIFKTRWFDKALSAMDENKRFAYAVFIDKQIAGATGYHNIDIKNRTIDIGYTWYHPSFWGTGINFSAKYLLLKQAFEECTQVFHRVGFCVDSMNQRSCKAVEKIGAHYEGTLRNHLIRPDGSIRHSCIFSILLEEWPQVKSHLQKKIIL